MTKLKALAVEYAGPMSVNVDSYYRQAKLDAYEAGFRKAKELFIERGLGYSWVELPLAEVKALGEEEAVEPSYPESGSFNEDDE